MNAKHETWKTEYEVECPWCESWKTEKGLKGLCAHVRIVHPTASADYSDLAFILCRD